MLYLYIPLGIALAAILVMAVIVFRKMPYLRKLTPESHEMGDTVLHDFAPEVVDRVRSIPWRQSFQNILMEFEKVLRRGRLLISSLDRISDTIIKKVRRVHEETERRKGDADRRAQERKGEAERRKEEADEIDMEDPDQLRQEEQRLIVAIAQHPKDDELYSDLARVYMRLQSYGDAVEALVQAVRLKPGDEQYLKRLERAKRKKEEAQKATAA